MEQEPLLGYERISISLPLTRLNTGSHRILMGDFGLDGYDDSPIANCGYYSKLFVALDIIWHLAFVLVSVFVLLNSISERPTTPLRVWIGVYAFQCLLHVGFVYLEYRRRNHADIGVQNGVSSLFPCHSSIDKSLASVNAVLSSIWWVFGFYWIVVGGQGLLQDSPRLYWLAVVFLTFDLCFMIFCIAMACVVFFALFFCFPILATVAYAMTIRGGASENDIRTLPKFKYCKAHSSGTFNNAKKQEVGLTVDSSSSNSTPELVLHPEDLECCICLHQYVDEAELCILPCNHHFHYSCISKWLRINATCPLCKFNVLSGEMLV